MENSDLATQTKVVMPCSLSHVMVMIRQLLLLSGDVELNPGPLDHERVEKILSTVDDTTFDEESWNDIIIACSSLAAKWKQLSGFMGLSFKTIRTIKENNPDDNEGAWNEAIMLWILRDYNAEKHGLPSWRSLLKTVSRVDETLFEKLAMEHQVKGTQVVPIMTEAMDKPKETNSDTGYEASCVISASSSSQITKQLAMESDVPDHILAQIRKKYSIIRNAYKRHCPCQLKNIASLDLVEDLQFSSMDERDNTSKHVLFPYSNLLNIDHNRRKDSKKIFIVGEAGIGKTILCSSIAEDWANGKLFQEFYLLFLLPLNQEGVTSAQNLQELFKSLEFDSEMGRTVEAYLMANKKDNVLIIADGWDEISESHSRQESFLYHLLFGDLLPSSSLTVLLTSRSAPVTEQRIHVSRFITIQGFSEETAKSYIQCEFSSSPEKLRYLIEQLEINPLVGSICSVPLNLAMICSFCRSNDDPLPSTMPELYDKLAWNLAQIKINGTEGCNNLLKLSNYQELPKKLQQSWSHLCQLAFEKCQSDVSQVLVSSFLSTKLETFGLLKSATVGRDKVMFSFLYPAFKYYLAISHLATRSQSEQLEVIKGLRHISPIFCRFYLSVNENLNCDIISEVVQKVHHSCKDMCLLSFESKKESVDQEVAKSLGSTVMFHSQNAYECIAMINMLEKIKQPSTVEINFQNCKLKASQVSNLANTLGNRSTMIQVQGLDLSNNSMSGAMVIDFFSRAAFAFGSLEKLFLRSCGIGAEGLSAIIDALAKSSCKSLTQLDLSFNSLSIASLECFQEYIDKDNLQKLEILVMKGSLAENFNVRFLKSFATSLSSKCRLLRRLDLSGNKIGACDNPDLSAIVSQFTSSLGISFDLRLDDDYMTEVDNNILTIMEESIRTKGTIDHTIAHGVIVGPGRSGKDTLMKRLTGEGPPEPSTISSSTGVLENVVKVEVKKLCTVATAVKNLKWQRLEYDKEALELMMTTTKNYSYVGSVQTPIIVKYVIQGNLRSKPEEEMESPLQPPDQGKESKLAITEGAKEPAGSESNDSVSMNEKEESNKHVIIYRDDLAPVDIFKEAVKLRHMDALREHLESSWSLYLTNTGGQIEFQEHLPLLVCGPSIFFIIFPLHHDLDKPYEVQYQYSDGFVKKYSSTPTLMQELQQTLSTIYALDYACVQIGDEEVQLTPKVFFVGTHKDCLPEPESVRERKIKQIDKKLQTHVRQTSLFRQGSIQFAHSKQMIFTVNNLSKDDDDFQMIRSAVQQTVEKKCYNEFTVQCPSSWLIFSLILRAKHMSNQVLKVEDCFKIAQECGISSHKELTTALSFIHSRLGLVRYFNVEELDSLVVVDPQVLFDKITDLIVETFINDEVNVEQNEIEEFREKGIISVSAMKKISERSNKDVRLPFPWLTKLLNHLRIAALFKDHQGEKYFFPSALCHVPEADDSSSDSSSDYAEPVIDKSPPLLIAFKSGFCPRGIAGALMKCLITNEMKSSRKWELLPKRIFRNEVSFHIEACGDVTIKMLPTHLEITIDFHTNVTESECHICTEVYLQITKSLKIVTTLYKKCEFFCTFYCTLAKCKTNPHPGVIEWNQKVPSRLRCKVLNKSGDLPNGYKLWNLQRKDVRSRSNAEVKYEHLGQIAESMVEWKGPIADQLKLVPSDVADIETKYPQRLKLQSREALYTWKGRHGSKATYSDLMEIFERASFKNYADEVRRLANISDSEADDSNDSGGEQPKTYPTLHKAQAFSHNQVPPSTTKSAEVYMMVEEKNLPEGNIGEICSEEVLESVNVAKSFVPKLLPNKVIAKDNEHRLDELQSKEVRQTIPESPQNEFKAIALYDYPGLEKEDIPLTRGQMVTVFDNSRELWWRARNQQGREGYIPSNYVKRLDIEDWFFPALSRTRAENILKGEGKEGGFVVRNSSTENMYALSICHNGQVTHYHIKQDESQKYYVSERHRFPSIKQLIEYHKLNAAGMVTRLRNPPIQLVPYLSTLPLFDEAWEIDKRELTLGRELGSGQFGRVVAGKWKSKVDVAIKMMVEGSINEEDFIEEAKVMKQLEHKNIVKLYGVCTKQGPIFIVQELLVNGSLLHYLRQHKELVEKTEILLDMAIQICSAMKYLESSGIIHRDLAAHNCMVGDRNVVKVEGFGQARFVPDNEYIADEEENFPVKWAAPEVIIHAKFSTRSDVWSYGILLWEVWTGGRTPYPTFTNSQTMDEVMMGYRLERPKLCPPEIHTLMGSCWLTNAEDRPTFATLFSSLQQIVNQDDN